MSVLGVFTGAASVGFFKLAAFGVDPFQATMSGFEQLFVAVFAADKVLIGFRRFFGFPNERFVEVRIVTI